MKDVTTEMIPFALNRERKDAKNEKRFMPVSSIYHEKAGNCPDVAQQ